MNELLYLLSKRWTTEVLFSIQESNHRFSGLKENHDISENMLADCLKLPEQHKLIVRNDDFNEVPARIEYELTQTGKKLSVLPDQLYPFAENETEFSAGCK